MKTTQRILRTNTYLLFSIFLLCGCHAFKGKDTTLDGKNKDTVTSKINSLPTTNQASHADTVLITDMKFIPGVIKVHKGDYVVWVNKDLVVHNVTELTDRWASPPIRSGASWKRTVKEPIDYKCSIHPEMKAKIVLE